MTPSRQDSPRPAGVSIALAAWLALLPGCAAPPARPGPAQTVPACRKLSTRAYSGPTDRLDPALVRHNALLARQFLLAIQKPAGNFIYEFDFRKGQAKRTDNPVRQAGTTWALAFAHRYCPDRQSLSALRQGLEFWWGLSHDIGQGRLAPLYGDRIFGITGMLSLVILTHVEALRCPLPEQLEARVRRKLDGYLRLLLDLRRPDGHFESHYSKLGHLFGDPSPYYDGESLLALAYAARHAGYAHLQPKILASAETMHQRWVVDAMATDPDHPEIKGFFHWGILSYYQIVQAGWDRRQRFANRAVQLGVWMVDVHQTLSRTRNTGYAYEGIIPAWDLAGRLGRTADRRKLDRTIRTGLFTLCTWQVGSPAANAELRAHPPATGRAVGGAMNTRFDPVLRNDTTQHQLHALILAERIYYGRANPTPTGEGNPSRRQSDPRSTGIRRGLCSPGRADPISRQSHAYVPFPQGACHGSQKPEAPECQQVQPRRRPRTDRPGAANRPGDPRRGPGPADLRRGRPGRRTHPPTCPELHLAGPVAAADHQGPPAGGHEVHPPVDRTAGDGRDRPGR